MEIQGPTPELLLLMREEWDDEMARVLNGSCATMELRGSCPAGVRVRARVRRNVFHLSGQQRYLD